MFIENSARYTWGGLHGSSGSPFAFVVTVRLADANALSDIHGYQHFCVSKSLII